MIPAFFRLRRLETTDSTNGDLRRAAESGEAAGLVVQALSQNAGRGRQQRVWDSPAGNLYCSALFRPHCSPQSAGLYSFAAALAVYDAVVFFLPQADVCLKWPNDVLVSGKKISGILLEAAPVEAGSVDWLVIGTGINVRSCPPDRTVSATSLALERPEKQEIQDVLEKYLENLEKWRLILEKDGFEALRPVWTARAKKGAIEARLGQESIRGVFEGLDAMGRLIVKQGDGTEIFFSAADVFFN